MKKFSLLPLLFASLFILAISGCDKCKNTTCENGGTCVDGECQCPPSYSGDNCENFTPCLNVVCNNGGTCNTTTGECDCAQGYEGPTCDEETRDKYVGSYTVDDDCYPQQYNCAIIKDPNEVTRFVFSDLGAYGVNDFYGVVDAPASNEPVLTFTIPNQTSSGVNMSGAGTYNATNGVLTITFTATLSGTTVNCEAIFTP